MVIAGSLGNAMVSISLTRRFLRKLRLSSIMKKMSHSGNVGNDKRLNDGKALGFLANSMKSGEPEASGSQWRKSRFRIICSTLGNETFFQLILSATTSITRRVSQWSDWRRGIVTISGLGCISVPIKLKARGHCTDVTISSETGRETSSTLASVVDLKVVVGLPNEPYLKVYSCPNDSAYNMTSSEPYTFTSKY